MRKWVINQIRNIQEQFLSLDIGFVHEQVMSALHKNKAMRIRMLYHYIWFNHMGDFRRIIKEDKWIKMTHLVWFHTDTCYLFENFLYLERARRQIKVKSIWNLDEMPHKNIRLIDSLIEYEILNWKVWQTNAKEIDQRVLVNNITYILLIKRVPIQIKRMRRLLAEYFWKVCEERFIRAKMNKDRRFENMGEWFYFLKSLIWDT